MRLQAQDFLSGDVLSDPGNPVVRSVNMLHKHLKPIYFALKNNQNRIPVEPETKHLINELKTANLGYLTDASQQLMIRDVVVNTIKVFEQQGFNQIGSAQVAGYLQQLEDAIADYFDLKLGPANTINDIDLAWIAIVDANGYLTSALKEVFNDYAQHVFRDLGRFNSLKIKIRKIERAIREAEKLESVISRLTLDQVAELSRGDRELYELLRDSLFVVVGECMAALSQAGHALRAAMGRWRLDMERGIKCNELVDDMAAYFVNGGVLEVYIDQAMLPDVCRAVDVGKYTEGDKIVDKGSVIFYADFTELEDSSVLLAMAREIEPRLKENEKVRESREQEQQAKMEAPLRDGSGFIDDEEHLFMEALDFLFESFKYTPEQNQLSAVESYLILEPGVGVDYWLSQILTSIKARLEKYNNFLKAGNHSAAEELEYLCDLVIEYQEDIDPVYDGNALVHDLIIKRKRSVAA